MEHDAGAADLREGELRPAELGGCKVLLARHGGRDYAIGDTCPHAGGPLHEGVLSDGEVLCPWHKAAFRLTDGTRTSPPAVDDVPAYSVREQGGRLIVDLEPLRSPAAARAGRSDDVFVVIGAGAAGAVAAQTLREAGFDGRVVMVSREDRLPYDRTVLSKYTLSGQEGGEKSPLQAAGYYDELGVERRCGEVAAVDAGGRRVVFADGSVLPYTQALLATGASPRTLTVPGHDLPGVHVLHTAADAESVLRTAEGATRAVVLGDGFIAVEAAGALRERGLEVTVVLAGTQPFERKLGAEVGGAFRRFHEGKGVAFRPRAKLVAVEGEGRVERVRLSDGAVLPADLVLAGLGVAPATGLLRGVSLRKDGGVPVDAGLRAADGLFAAGDLTAFPYRGDGDEVRVEHWRVAQQHGRVAALNMLGGHERFEAVPYFWTIHYKKRLDYVGHAASWDEVVIDGDLSTPDFAAYYVKDDRVAAVAGWGRDTPMAACIGLMQQWRDWTVQALRDVLPD